MNDLNPVLTDQVERALVAVGSGLTAAAFHGQVTGLWCRMAQLPDDLGMDEIDAHAADWRELQAFAQHIWSELEDPSCGFAPLLPDDGQALVERVDALADWAESFLVGLGMAGPLDMAVQSEDVKEMIGDLTEICRLDVDDLDEDAEDDFAELVEYLKVAAQTLYLELHPKQHESKSEH